MAGYAAEIGLPRQAAFELRLDGLGCVATAGKHHEPRGVCIESMSGGEVFSGKRTGQDLRHAVAVKPTAWVHRQRRRLVEHDVVVFPCNDSDRRVHIRLDRVGLEPREPLPTSEANATAIAYDQVRRGDVSLSDMKRQIERDCIARALAETKGNITKAATLLGMKRPRLSQLVKQYGFTATEGV